MTKADQMLNALDVSPVARLRWMADALKSDPAMQALLRAAADAWAGGDRSPLAVAALGLANSVWADIRAGVVERTNAGGAS